MRVRSVARAVMVAAAIAAVASPALAQQTAPLRDPDVIFVPTPPSHGPGDAEAGGCGGRRPTSSMIWAVAMDASSFRRPKTLGPGQ